MNYIPSYTVPEIIKMLEEGNTHAQIAKRFGISRSRVWQIIQKERQRKDAMEQSQCIRRQLYSDNNPDTKISVNDLLALFCFSSVARKTLLEYFDFNNINELSLRGMMDLLVPVIRNPGQDCDLFEILPAYKLRNIGSIHYAGMIKRLSVTDCGELFTKEWMVRKKMLCEFLSTHKRDSYLYKMLI